MTNLINTSVDSTNVPSVAALEFDFNQINYFLISGPKIKTNKGVSSSNMPNMPYFASELKNVLNLKDSEVIVYSFSKDDSSNEFDFVSNPSFVKVIEKTTASVKGLEEMLNRRETEGLILEPFPNLNLDGDYTVKQTYIPDKSDLVFIVQGRDDNIYMLSPIETFSDSIGIGYHTEKIKSALYSTAKFLTPGFLKPLAKKIKSKLATYNAAVKTVDENPYFMEVGVYSSKTTDALEF